MICRRCGRILKNPKSIALGIGPTCLKKETTTGEVKTFFTMEEIAAMFNIPPEVIKKIEKQAALQIKVFKRINRIPYPMILKDDNNVNQSRNKKLPKP